MNVTVKIYEPLGGIRRITARRSDDATYIRAGSILLSDAGADERTARMVAEIVTATLAGDRS